MLYRMPQTNDVNNICDLKICIFIVFRLQIFVIVLSRSNYVIICNFQISTVFRFNKKKLHTPRGLKPARSGY